MNNPKCPKCGNNTVKNGVFPSGLTRYRCLHCKWTNKSPNKVGRPKYKGGCSECSSVPVVAKGLCQRCYNKQAYLKRKSK